MENDLCRLTARQLLSAYRRRKLSPVEVVEAVLQRITLDGPKLNAFCTLLPDEARKQARKAEKAYLKKQDAPPLLGVPVSIKDLIFTKGVRTTGGSRLFENFVPDEDEPAVARLRAAGAVIIGKTNTPEFGYKAATDNPLFGITRNPWNTDKTPGGSSGGAAASVAAGMCPIALGSDGGGSIRIPSALCGVFGLKPSFGRVPRYPSFPGWETLAHTGPITRTVADAALVMDIIAGPDERDRSSLPPISGAFSRSLSGAVKGTKIAWSPTLGYATVEPEILKITGEAAKLFRRAGCRVEEINPALENPEAELSIFVMADFQAAIGDSLEDNREKMDPRLVTLVEMGKNISAKEYVQASFRRQVFHERVQKIFEKYDFLLTPTTAVAAFQAGKMAPETVAGQRLSPLAWMPFTYPFNFTGQPAASVPCGFTEDHLPVGLQIVGRRHDDAGVLRLSAVFEKLYPWPDFVPTPVRDFTSKNN
ncbi:MAG: amidase [Candidatus Abyssobacteria bacterium SURF_5]|uniref:Amidase n=1 Tax=Abyssobacteria bacterium (strain SURF_5) TaxID=2093360 RepID=A0A3A4NY18_ABYX5|nr:MAG: amidase [Candidatus Abyssubacteria bacterium SURF_5]